MRQLLFALILFSMFIPPLRAQQSNSADFSFVKTAPVFRTSAEFGFWSKQQAQEGWTSERWLPNWSKFEWTDPTNERSKVGKEHDLLLTITRTFSTLHDTFDNQHAPPHSVPRQGTRGWFEYYITNFFSFTGTSHLEDHAYGNVEVNFWGGGLNLHFAHLDNLDIFLGGSSGFNVVTAGDSIPTKWIPVIQAGGGLNLFVRGWHFVLEIHHEKSEFYSTRYHRPIHLNLNRNMLSIGFGIDRSLHKNIF